jgi:prepilin-type N-terminal cleavage/methylation domain-containing protein
MKNNKIKTNRGFTLIELIVVMAILAILVMIAVPAMLGHTKKAEWTNLSPNVKSLGIPLSEYYEQEVDARNVWDLTVHENRLYIGAGNYDKNNGPVPVMCYDIKSEKWISEGIIEDEQINKYIKIDNKLIIPGTDPKEDWNMGNYYEYTNGSWQKHRALPQAIHCFDMVNYKGQLFAGMGVDNGYYPIAYSDGVGSSFTQVPMYKNGELFLTDDFECVRVFDFFVKDNKLYALFAYGTYSLTYDLYQYDNGVFIFDNSWQNMQTIKNWYVPIGGKAVFNNKLFFTTGVLYSTENMSDLKRIPFKDINNVTDLFVLDDVLYVLGWKKTTENKYTITVLKSKTGVYNDFEKFIEFIYEVPANSFTYSDGVFYFGMGSLGNNNEKTGTILSVVFK